MEVTVARVTWVAGKFMAIRILNMLKKPMIDWGQFVSQYLQNICGIYIPPERLTVEMPGIGSREVMRALGEAFLKPMLNIILPHPDELKTDPLAGAERFLSVNTQFQLSSWMLDLFSDIYGKGHFRSLRNLPHNLSWSLGLSWLSWLVLGVPFRRGCADPMEKVWNRIYTPELLTVPQAIEALQKGQITPSEYVDALLDRGFSPRLANLLYQLAQKDYTDTTIRRLLNIGWMDESEAKEELKRRGYDEKRAGFLARLYRDQRKFELVDDILEEASKRYLEGVVDESTLRRLFERAGWKPEEMELKLRLIELKGKARRYLTPAQVAQLWNQGILGHGEARAYLIDLGMTEEDADLYMMLKRKTEKE